MHINEAREFLAAETGITLPAATKTGRPEWRFSGGQTNANISVQILQSGGRASHALVTLSETPSPQLRDRHEIELWYNLHSHHVPVAEAFCIWHGGQRLEPRAPLLPLDALTQIRQVAAEIGVGARPAELAA